MQNFAVVDDYFVNLCNFVHFLSVNKFKSKQEFKADVPSAEVKKKASAAALSVVNSEPKIETLAPVVAKKESSEDLLPDDNNATEETVKGEYISCFNVIERSEISELTV